MKQRKHKHLPLVDNFAFMQWCDLSNLDVVKCRTAFILVRQDGLSVAEAAETLRITKMAVYDRIQKYVKLCDEYLKETKNVRTKKRRSPNR